MSTTQIPAPAATITLATIKSVQTPDLLAARVRLQARLEAVNAELSRRSEIAKSNRRRRAAQAARDFTTTPHATL